MASGLLVLGSQLQLSQDNTISMRYLVDDLVDGVWLCQEEFGTYEEALHLLTELKIGLLKKGTAAQEVERILRITMRSANPGGTRSLTAAERAVYFPPEPKSPSLLERLQAFVWLAGVISAALIVLTVLAFILPSACTTRPRDGDMNWARQASTQFPAARLISTTNCRARGYQLCPGAAGLMMSADKSRVRSPSPLFESLSGSVSHLPHLFEKSSLPAKPPGLAYFVRLSH